MSYYVPLPAYNTGRGINFEPVNQALEGILQQNNANRQYGLQEKASSRADQQFALDKRNSDMTAEAQLAKQSGGIAQAALNERDPSKKASMMAQLYGLHPEYKNKLISAGIDPNDYDSTANFIVATARGYVNPQETALNDAKIQEARAGITKSNAEVAAMRRQAALDGQFFPELGISPDGSGVGSPGASYGAAPSNAFAPPMGGPPNAMMPNALMSGQPSTISNAPPPQTPRNALATPSGPNSPASNFPGSPPGRDPGPPVPYSGGGVPDFAGGYRTQGNAPGPSPGPHAVSPPSPSMALPAPGDPTSFTGDSAAGLITPSRLSADTLRALKWDRAFNGGKGSSSIINNDPGSKYATAYATKTAEDNASLNLKQKMTAPLLAQIQHMRDIATESGPDVLTKATGPDYSEGQEGSWLPGFLHPDTSGQPYQNLRAWGHWADVPGRALGWDDAKSYDQAAKVNLQMQHIKKMLGASVKALPGTKGGGASTDQDQALVLDAVGEAMHAQDPETFFKILHDAENGLRARSGMGPLPKPKSYVPAEWSQPQTAAGDQGAPQGGSQTASALAGARVAIARGAPAAAVKQRLLQNGIDPGAL